MLVGCQSTGLWSDGIHAMGAAVRNRGFAFAYTVGEMKAFQVRFELVEGPSGLVLSYCLATPFVSPGFSDYGPAVSFESRKVLKARLVEVGLPWEISTAVGLAPGAFGVTEEQLSSLGFNALPS
jgi:hypothetical protein